MHPAGSIVVLTFTTLPEPIFKGASVNVIFVVQQCGPFISAHTRTQASSVTMLKNLLVIHEFGTSSTIFSSPTVRAFILYVEPTVPFVPLCVYEYIGTNRSCEVFIGCKALDRNCPDRTRRKETLLESPDPESLYPKDDNHSV